MRNLTFLTITSLFLIGAFSRITPAQAWTIKSPAPRIQSDRPASQEKRSTQNKTAPADANRLPPKTQAAVDRAVAYLISQQRADGAFGKPGQNDPATTALSGLALLAAGHSTNEGDYAQNLKKAVDYVCHQVQENGYIGTGSMYVHAYSLRFLSAAHLADPTPETNRAIKQAVQLIVRSQNDNDGWRYIPTSQDADSSVTSCIVIALQCARRSGVAVPQETIRRAVDYLQQCQAPDGGFSYTLPVSKSELPRSAAVMSALQLSGNDDSTVENGHEYLRQALKNHSPKSAHYFFGQFHLCTVIKDVGDETFQQWYRNTEADLIAIQHEDGSWNSRSLDPIYVTAQSCFVLLAPRLAGNRRPVQP